MKAVPLSAPCSSSGLATTSNSCSLKVFSAWKKAAALDSCPTERPARVIATIAAVVVYFSLRIGTSIITAASLSFIGMGAQPPTPEWGAMLNEARADMMTSPHVALFPSLAIFLTVLAFNLLGDGLRDALDPKIDQK